MALREKRDNHAQDRVKSLLAVPWYADVLEGTVLSDDDDIQAKSVPPRSVLVKSSIGW